LKYRKKFNATIEENSQQNIKLTKQVFETIILFLILSQYFEKCCSQNLAKCPKKLQSIVTAPRHSA